MDNITEVCVYVCFGQLLQDTLELVVVLQRVFPLLLSVSVR